MRSNENGISHMPEKIYLILRSVAQRRVSKECAEHVHQLGGGSPLPILMVEKG